MINESFTVASCDPLLRPTSSEWKNTAGPFTAGDEPHHAVIINNKINMINTDQGNASKYIFLIGF